MGVPRRLAAVNLLMVGALAGWAPGRNRHRSCAPDSPAATKAPDGKATASRRLPDALRFANGLLRQRKYELAAKEYERFLKAGATGLDGADARFGLANARLNQGEYRAALAAFDEFLKTAADDSRAATARYRVGELSYLTGDLTAARRALETFTAAQPGHPGQEMAWTYLGDACFGLGDLPAARRAYERSLALYPRGRMASRAKYGLARTLADSGERDRALETLQELVTAAEPDWVDRAWLQIGLIRSAAGQYAGAVEAFSTLERVAPKSPFLHQARLQRALALARLERADESDAILRTLASDPGSSAGAQAALELATSELKRDRALAALATIEEALKRFPKSPAVPAFHFRLAEALQKQNRLQEARARFLRVVELDPKDPWADDALERAAQLSVDLGEPAEARRLADAFLAKFPESPLRGDVRSDPCAGCSDRRQAR